MVHKIRNFSYTDDEGTFHNYEFPTWEDTKEYYVTYYGSGGQTFKVILREKKYPIGFSAKW